LRLEGERRTAEVFLRIALEGERLPRAAGTTKREAEREERSCKTELHMDVLKVQTLDKHAIWKQPNAVQV